MEIDMSNELLVKKRRGSCYEKDGFCFCKEWTYVEYDGREYVVTEEDAKSIEAYHLGEKVELTEWSMDILEKMTECVECPKEPTEEEKGKIRKVYNMTPYMYEEVEVDQDSDINIAS